ncbi:MAG: tetratricopeptide repeat protein [Oscillospiraceae bacterium]|nr:tetratricopeptide repeat protein [Oscillospiraceae bacterium]
MNRVFKRMIVVAVLCAMVLMLTGCDSADYKKAMGLYESGDFAAAEALFLELEDYENSAEMVTACRYGAAVAMMDAGNYTEAAAAFEALGDYEDSAARLKQIPGLMVVQWLQVNGAQTYENPDPEYTVTLDVDADGVLVMEYWIGSSGDNWKLEAVFTAKVTLGNSEAALNATGYMSLLDAYMDDKGSCTWHIDTYEIGDSVTWEDYSLDGRKTGGSPLDADAEGIIMGEGIITTSLERMVDGAKRILADSGLNVTIADIGFLAA